MFPIDRARPAPLYILPLQALQDLAAGTARELEAAHCSQGEQAQAAAASIQQLQAAVASLQQQGAAQEAAHQQRLQHLAGSLQAAEQQLQDLAAAKAAEQEGAQQLQQQLQDRGGEVADAREQLAAVCGERDRAVARLQALEAEHRAVLHTSASRWAQG